MDYLNTKDITLVQDDELEGNTLLVYAYVAKEGKPVGPRDVTRGANLSSPSVAHRHLQKLDSLGLLEKDAYGNYLIKQKAPIKGHLWVGKNVLPRMLIYSFFFIGALIGEIGAIIYSFYVGLEIEPEFLFIALLALTISAAAILLTETIMLTRKKPI